MLNEQHLHTHLLTNKLHEGFAANYAQFFSTFSFKSGQTTRQKITQGIRGKKTRNYPISFNVYICPMKFNLIKGQAGQQKPKQREKETQIKGETGEEEQWQHKSISAPKGRSCTERTKTLKRDEAGRRSGWACPNEIALSSGQGNNVRCPSSHVPCRISLSSLVRCPYPVSFWPIADCLTVTCLLAFNFICDALPPTPLLLPLPISLLVFKEAANWTLP